MQHLNKVIGLVLAAGLTLGSMTATGLAQTKGSIISFNGPAGEAYIGRFIRGIKGNGCAEGLRYQGIREPVQPGGAGPASAAGACCRAIARRLHLVAI